MSFKGLFFLGRGGGKILEEALLRLFLKDLWRPRAGCCSPAILPIKRDVRNYNGLWGRSYFTGIPEIF
jgi:hypothetical protein